MIAQETLTSFWKASRDASKEQQPVHTPQTSLEAQKGTEEQKDILPIHQSSVPLTSEEAVQYAVAVVNQLPGGYEFTVNGLFCNMRHKGSKKGARAAMINACRRAGIIKAVGITQKDQEQRNHGFATLWRKI